MALLLDAQLPPRLARLISDWGYPASHVYDHLPAEAPDAEVAQLANALPAALMSKDADFLDLVNRNILVTTFVWVRSGNIDTGRLWSTIQPGLPHIVAAIAAAERVVEVL